jgi:transcriptional regulator with XRE-family HTH domain
MYCHQQPKSMHFVSSMSEIITPAQSRAARALIGMSQTELAEASGMTRVPLANFEAGKTSPYPKNLEAIKSALEAAGVEFIPENGGGAGVRLRKP